MKRSNIMKKLSILLVLVVFIVSGCSGNDSGTIEDGETTETTEVDEETTDVVIVGAGIAGISAAFELKNNYPDIDFVIVEKQGTVGGSLAYTGGAIFGYDSEIHEKDKVEASNADQVIEFFTETSNSESINKELITNSFDFSTDTLKLFGDLGAPYTGSSEKVDASNDVLYSVRMEDKGQGFYQFVKKVVEEDNPFDLRLKTEVTELIVDSDNKVTGVKVAEGDKAWTINAKQVILATGGFGTNPELMEKYAPNYADGVISTNGGATGDAILLTEDLGTQVIGDGTMGTIVAEDRSNLIPSMFMINEEGQRFTNEAAPKYVLQRAVADLENNIAYIIADQSVESYEGLSEAMESDLVTKYDTIEELAKAAGVDFETLNAEIQAYNEAVEAKLSPGFDLPADKATKIVTAPFYLEKAVVRTFGTIPGILVNENTQVLNADNNEIEGLFACGEIIAANAFDRRYPGVGIGIAFAANTGRLSALNAAELIKE